jgi:hypothetical protein
MTAPALLQGLHVAVTGPRMLAAATDRSSTRRTSPIPATARECTRRPLSVLDLALPRRPRRFVHRAFASDRIAQDYDHACRAAYQEATGRRLDGRRPHAADLLTDFDRRRV